MINNWIYLPSHALSIVASFYKAMSCKKLIKGNITKCSLHLSNNCLKKTSVLLIYIFHLLVFVNEKYLVYKYRLINPYMYSYVKK